MRHGHGRGGRHQERDDEIIRLWKEEDMSPGAIKVHLKLASRNIASGVISRAHLKRAYRMTEESSQDAAVLTDFLRSLLGERKKDCGIYA